MTYQPQLIDLKQDSASGIATVTLNRPERLNALTFEIYQELVEVFDFLDTAPGVRCILLTGTGRGFCSGGDVESIIGKLLGRDYQALLEFTRMTCNVVLAMRKCRHPIVAGLNGTVAGAGAMLALASDIRIAAERAKIAFLFTRVGLSGADMGAAWLLPRIIGMGRATQLLMTGEFVDARQAEQFGLYNQVVEDHQLANAAREFAERLAKGPQFGLEMTKDLLNREANMDLWGALETEAQAQANCMLHPDFREAYEAFTNRRDPIFSR